MAPEIIEAVVRSDSYLVGRSAISIRCGRVSALPSRHGARRKDGARGNQRSHGSRRARTLDTGRAASAKRNARSAGLVAVESHQRRPFRRSDAAIRSVFLPARSPSPPAGFPSFTVAIAIAVTAYVALGQVPAGEFYSQIEWPVVVMLACLLPLGSSFRRGRRHSFDRQFHRRADARATLPWSRSSPSWQ